MLAGVKPGWRARLVAGLKQAGQPYGGVPAAGAQVGYDQHAIIIGGADFVHAVHSNQCTCLCDNLAPHKGAEEGKACRMGLHTVGYHGVKAGLCAGGR